MTEVSGGRQIAVLGAGLAGCAAALQAARCGLKVDLFDRLPYPMRAASLHNEGKLHLGYVYAADPDRATHQRLTMGSLRFLFDIEVLTGVPRTTASVSRRFHYAAPHDSLFSVDAIEAHFEAVDENVLQLLRDGAPYPVAFSRSLRVTPGEVGLSDSSVSAAFETSEVALETGWIADLVGAAVLSMPQITFHGSHEICSAGIESNGARIEWMGPEASGSRQYCGVINALWQDRARLDAKAGLDSPLDQWLW